MFQILVDFLKDYWWAVGLVLLLGGVALVAVMMSSMLSQMEEDEDL